MLHFSVSLLTYRPFGSYKFLYVFKSFNFNKFASKHDTPKVTRPRESVHFIEFLYS